MILSTGVDFGELILVLDDPEGTSILLKRQTSKDKFGSEVKKSELFGTQYY
jgi:hypothetical protein